MNDIVKHVRAGKLLDYWDCGDVQVEDSPLGFYVRVGTQKLYLSRSKFDQLALIVWSRDNVEQAKVDGTLIERNECVISSEGPPIDCSDCNHLDRDCDGV